MSGGENKVEVGEITQSSVRGNAMESVLASVLNTPGIQKEPKKIGKQVK